MSNRKRKRLLRLRVGRYVIYLWRDNGLSEGQPTEGRHVSDSQRRVPAQPLAESVQLDPPTGGPSGTTGTTRAPC